MNNHKIASALSLLIVNQLFMEARLQKQRIKFTFLSMIKFGKRGMKRGSTLETKSFAACLESDYSNIGNSFKRKDACRLPFEWSRIANVYITYTLSIL